MSSLSARGALRLELVVAAALLLGAGPAIASEEARLPWDPFAGARPGEWATYDVTLRATEASGEAAVVSTDVLTWTVASVSSSAVVIRRSDGTERTFAPGPPPLAAFLELSEGETPDVVKAEEAPRVASGRSFPCTRVSFALGDLMGRREEVVLWLSREVPGARLVAMEWRRFPRAGASETVTLELAGFGTGAVAAWGRRP